MKRKHEIAFMKTAYNWAECSTARRGGVGCIVVKNGRVISTGYNGTRPGADNNCEDKTQLGLITHNEVIHAEANAIGKLSRSNESSEGAIVFITMMPCLDCAKLLLVSGITEVYYAEDYRDTSGIDYLLSADIKVENLSI